MQQRDAHHPHPKVFGFVPATLGCSRITWANQLFPTHRWATSTKPPKNHSKPKAYRMAANHQGDQIGSIDTCWFTSQIMPAACLNLSCQVGSTTASMPVKSSLRIRAGKYCRYRLPSSALLSAFASLPLHHTGPYGPLVAQKLASFVPTTKLKNIQPY